MDHRAVKTLVAYIVKIPAMLKPIIFKPNLPQD